MKSSQRSQKSSSPPSPSSFSANLSARARQLSKRLLPSWLVVVSASFFLSLVGASCPSKVLDPTLYDAELKRCVSVSHSYAEYEDCARKVDESFGVSSPAQADSGTGAYGDVD